MIAFPTSVEAALAVLVERPGDQQPEPRAGGTDLQHRRQHGLSAGPIVDLRYVPGLDHIEEIEGGLRIGAGVRVAEIAMSPLVRAGYPALAEAAHDLATPQIRAVATLGGNLLQHNRCWYYRSSAYTCLKKGGATCFAREGDHIFHSCFDLGPCVAPHPSTLALALLAYEARVDVAGGLARTVAELYGDGSDARNHHQLDHGELITGVVLPPPTQGEQSAYLRVASRARAEWPLVDVVIRLVIADGRVERAAVVLGGVANIPLRLPAVEEALVGHSPSEETWGAAAAAAETGANPLPGTRYKVRLLAPAVRDAIARALDRPPVLLPPPPAPAPTVKGG